MIDGIAGGEDTQARIGVGQKTCERSPYLCYCASCLKRQSLR